MDSMLPIELIFQPVNRKKFLILRRRSLLHNLPILIPRRILCLRKRRMSAHSK